MADLFTGREVVSYSQFRVTRNSDLWVDEEEVKNLRQALQSELHGRQYGFAVRLEVGRTCPPHLSDFLLNQFDIDRSRLFTVDGPVNLGRLLEIVNSTTSPDLKFPPYVPGFPAKLDPRRHLRHTAQAGRAAAPPVRVVPAGDRLHPARGDRPERGGDQADHLPGRHEFRADGSPDHGRRSAARKSPSSSN